MDKNVGAKGGPSKRIKISGPEDSADDMVFEEQPVEKAEKKPAKSIKITGLDESEEAADVAEKVETAVEPKAAKVIKITASDEPEEVEVAAAAETVEKPVAEEVPEEPKPAEASPATKIAVSTAAVKSDDHIEEPAPRMPEPVEQEPEVHTAQVHPPVRVAQPVSPSPIPVDPPVDVQEQDVFEAASHASEEDSEPDYSQYTALRKPKKNWKKPLLWTLLVLFVVGGVAAGGYVLYKQRNDNMASNENQSNKQSSSNNSNSSQSSQSSQSSSASGTKDYSSSNLQVSFSYPEKWTVDDTSGSKLTVTSPIQKLTDANGQPQDVKIVMRIEKQDSADMSDFKTGDAAAVLQSEKINYANPTGTQRANTYISFVQYSATTTKGALDGIYVTGNLGYTYAQAIKEADIAKIDPLVRVVFVKCSDSNCTSPAATNISSDEWKDKNFSQPITDMFESLSFQ